eukprot:scaffold48640_cov46-Prasinocladus_malaysianus.AAC.1
MYIPCGLRFKPPKNEPVKISHADFFDNYTDVTKEEASRYRIVEIAGQGSYGQVATAIDTKNGDRVAIKKVDHVPLINCMKKVATLSLHENICEKEAQPKAEAKLCEKRCNEKSERAQAAENDESIRGRCPNQAHPPASLPAFLQHGIFCYGEHGEGPQGGRPPGKVSDAGDTTDDSLPDAARDPLYAQRCGPLTPRPIYVALCHRLGNCICIRI